VKYVKHNFLYGRGYYDLETLQAEAMGWLRRTGNGMPHSVTRKIPLQEWEQEKVQLSAWKPVKILPSHDRYTVRKDHTISYKGNFYSVPQGTYQKGAGVRLLVEDQQLHIVDLEGTLLCQHVIPEGKGHCVINTNHRRNRAGTIDQLIAQTAARFQDPAGAKQYLERIRKEKGRYIRDHVQAVDEAKEEGLDTTLQKKLKDKNIAHHNLTVASILPDSLVGFDFIFLDSVTRLGLSPDDLLRLRAAYPNQAFIFVFQTTKDGNFKGANAFQHDVDVIIEVPEKGKAVQYGRFNQGGEMEIF